jgi:hypothetical protein
MSICDEIHDHPQEAPMRPPVRRLLIDNTQESVQESHGGRDNQAVVIDAEGRIAFKQPHTDHRELRRFLQEHLR